MNSARARIRASLIASVLWLGHAQPALADSYPDFGVSATEATPCPPGTEETGARPPAGDRTSCVRRTDDGGVLEGPQTLWYPGGPKRQETHYRAGRPHGLKLDWGIRGNLMQKWEFENGVLHGEHVIFSPAGSVMRREAYVSGRRQAPPPRPVDVAKPSSARPAPPRPAPAKPAASRPVPAQTRVRGFVCELEAEALESRLAEDRKFFETLTRGQLRLVHTRPSLLAEITASPDGMGVSRLQSQTIHYRLESTNELGFSSQDPIQETVREREAGMRGIAGRLQGHLGDLLVQWKALMAGTPAAAPGAGTEDAPPVPPPALRSASGLVLQEAELQKISGEPLPSRLFYSAGEGQPRMQMALKSCRRSR